MHHVYHYFWIPSHVQYDCFLTEHLVVISALASGIQTKMSFFEHQKEVIFQYDFF